MPILNKIKASTDSLKPIVLTMKKEAEHICVVYIKGAPKGYFTNHVGTIQHSERLKLWDGNVKIGRKVFKSRAASAKEVLAKLNVLVNEKTK